MVVKFFLGVYPADINSKLPTLIKKHPSVSIVAVHVSINGVSVCQGTELVKEQLNLIAQSVTLLKCCVVTSTAVGRKFLDFVHSLDF